VVRTADTKGVTSTASSGETGKLAQTFRIFDV